tara:strand:- start:472 stop:747 length:276 start_codon:yes stop_codon:yes gene_type:complete
MMIRKIVTKSFFLLIPLMAIMSCTTASEITMPSGVKGFVVSCGGTANSWASCYKKASTSCPSGYNILEKDEERVIIVDSPGINRTLVISCR